MYAKTIVNYSEHTLNEIHLKSVVANDSLFYELQNHKA